MGPVEEEALAAEADALAVEGEVTEPAEEIALAAFLALATVPVMAWCLVVMRLVARSKRLPLGSGTDPRY